MHSEHPSAGTYDLLLRGGDVVDGTGAKRRRADVGVVGDLITAVRPDLPVASAGRVVDVGGLVVTPGFIDLHSHSDFTFTTFPESPGQVTQGVTSELSGNCGYSPAPLSASSELAAAWEDVAHGIAPGLEYRWRSFAEWLAAVDAARPSVNCLPLVGHSTLRVCAMGMKERAPDRTEIEAMQAGLREALSSGAWGMSTGLSYAPGQWAETGEIIKVGRPLADVDAIYVSHIRNESDEVIPAVEEALEIARALGVRVEVSHLKAAGVRNYGRTEQALGLISEARARGVRATCDMYPYEAGSAPLSALLPPWVFEGGIERMLERLRSDDVRRAIRHDIAEGIRGWGNLLRAAGGWDRVLVNGTTEPEAAWANGRFVSQLTEQTGRDGLDTACDLIIQDRGATTMAIFMMSMDDVRGVLASPIAGVGSDLYAVVSAETANHPRCSGSFARMLAWSREGLVPLEEAVRKMTSLAADTIGLTDRGRVQPGLVADLVAFDPATVADRATWQEPARLATGVEHVLLGGRFAVQQGRPVNLRLGGVLRRDATRTARPRPA